MAIALAVAVAVLLSSLGVQRAQALGWMGWLQAYMRCRKQLRYVHKLRQASGGHTFVAEAC